MHSFLKAFLVLMKLLVFAALSYQQRFTDFHGCHWGQSEWFIAWWNFTNKSGRIPSWRDHCALR